MKRFQVSILSVAMTCFSIPVIGYAQQGHSHEGHNHAEHGDHDHSGEVLGFQLKDWKESHFEDAAKAEQHLQTLKKLGCEAEKSGHAGHIDIRYRAKEWKTMTAANHDLAHQWEGWLKEAGFDVFHGHQDASFSKGPESVEFRLVEWKTLHGEGNEKEQAAVIDILKKLGTEVKIDKHDGHSDIKYRAPIWIDIHVADHATSEKWTNWLRANGFETQHEH
ncbi:hypothetical protein [Lacunimicrobium album]